MLRLHVVIHYRVCYALRYVIRMCHCLIPLWRMERSCVWRGLEYIWFSAVGREKKGGFQREMEKGRSSRLGSRGCLGGDWGRSAVPETTSSAEHLVAAGPKLLLTFFGNNVFSAINWNMKSRFYGQIFRGDPPFHNNIFVMNMFIFFSCFYFSLNPFLSIRNHSHISWWKAEL